MSYRRRVLWILSMMLFMCLEVHADDWNGRWVAGTNPIVSGSLADLQRRCVLDIWAESILDMSTSPDGQVEGTIIRTLVVGVFFPINTRTRITREEVARVCTLPSTKHPLDGSQIKYFTFVGRPDGDNKLRIAITSHNCVEDNDWCPTYPGQTPLGDGPFTLTRLSNDTIVWDDTGTTALDDDISHFWKESRLNNHLDSAQVIVERYISSLIRNDYQEYLSVADVNLRTRDIMQAVRGTVISELGNAPSGTVIVRRIMTFPDPDDPADYVSFIYRLSSPSGRYTNFYIYLRGIGSDMRVYWGALRGV